MGETFESVYGKPMTTLSTELSLLREKATKGPWRSDGPYSAFVTRYAKTRRGNITFFDGKKEEGGGCDVRDKNTGTICSMTWSGENRKRETDANAALIVALVNNLDTIIALLEKE